MEKYLVRLSKEERTNLLGLIKKGKSAAYKLLTHARILLEADEDNGPIKTDKTTCPGSLCLSSFSVTTLYQRGCV